MVSFSYSLYYIRETDVVTSILEGSWRKMKSMPTYLFSILPWGLLSLGYLHVESMLYFQNSWAFILTSHCFDLIFNIIVRIPYLRVFWPVIYYPEPAAIFCNITSPFTIPKYWVICILNYYASRTSLVYTGKIKYCTKRKQRIHLGRWYSNK